MILARRFLLIVILVSFFFPLAVAHGEEGKAIGGVNVVLNPADQMILKAIGKVNERIDMVAQELNGRIDKINERIDNLWITMLGGFLGVMAFIGGIGFWDRRTFLRRVREECRGEIIGDRQKLEAMLAAMRKLGSQFPEVREVLRNFGLL